MPQCERLDRKSCGPVSRSAYDRPVIVWFGRIGKNSQHMTNQLADRDEAALLRFAHALVDQESARVIVPPKRRETGFWFGGGNMIEDPKGCLYVVGRYRNHGDSRTGLHLGERGLELAIFRSSDRGQTFEKLVSWTKAEEIVG